MKKERWSELEVIDLPPGELEYFDRKSGILFSDEGGLSGARVQFGTDSSQYEQLGGHALLRTQTSKEEDAEELTTSCNTEETLEPRANSLVCHGTRRYYLATAG